MALAVAPLDLTVRDVPGVKARTCPPGTVYGRAERLRTTHCGGPHMSAEDMPGVKARACPLRADEPPGSVYSPLDSSNDDETRASAVVSPGLRTTIVTSFTVRPVGGTWATM